MIHHNTVTKSFQNKNSLKNEAVFAALVAHGFSMDRIRKSLVQLNGIRLRDLAGDDLSITTVSNTLQGRRYNERVAADVSRRLGLSHEQLFPEQGGA